MWTRKMGKYLRALEQIHEKNVSTELTFGIDLVCYRAECSVHNQQTIMASDQTWVWNERFKSRTKCSYIAGPK